MGRWSAREAKKEKTEEPAAKHVSVDWNRSLKVRVVRAACVDHKWALRLRFQIKITKPQLKGDDSKLLLSTNLKLYYGRFYIFLEGGVQHRASAPHGSLQHTHPEVRTKERDQWRTVCSEGQQLNLKKREEKKYGEKKADAASDSKLMQTTPVRGYCE